MEVYVGYEVVLPAILSMILGYQDSQAVSLHLENSPSGTSIPQMNIFSGHIPPSNGLYFDTGK